MRKSMIYTDEEHVGRISRPIRLESDSKRFLEAFLGSNCNRSLDFGSRGPSYRVSLVEGQLKSAEVYYLSSLRESVLPLAARLRCSIGLDCGNFRMIIPITTNGTSEYGN